MKIPLLALGVALSIGLSLTGCADQNSPSAGTTATGSAAETGGAGVGSVGGANGGLGSGVGAGGAAVGGHPGH